MTVYWWSHWFWITACLSIGLGLIYAPSRAHSWPVANQPESEEPAPPATSSLRPDTPARLNTKPFNSPPARAGQPAYRRRTIDTADVDDDLADVFDGGQGWTAERIASMQMAEVVPAAIGVAEDGLAKVESAKTGTATVSRSAEEMGKSVAVTRRPPLATRMTTIVPREEIIATRLSTRKRPLSGAEMVNVARVNVTMIRSSTRSNKSSNFSSSASLSSSSSSSSMLTSATSLATSSSSTSRSISPSPAAAAAPVINASSSTSVESTINTSVSADIQESPSEPDLDDRHNFTNELSVRPFSAAGKASIEKGPSGPGSSSSSDGQGLGGIGNGGGRQSKVLLTGAGGQPEPVESGPQSAQQQRSALEANLVNYTGYGKTGLAELAEPMAMNAEASREADSSESRALPVKRSAILDAGAISGICVAAVALCGVVSAGGVLLYRRRFVNKPQTLSEPDSSGYIDDSINRDNSDEMYSLDNDSFLNSLEAMTIQNYWTENVKHTKL